MSDVPAGFVPFEYAVLRAVPRVDRGECVNVGVVLYCQARDYLGTRLHLDDDRLRALHPGTDLDAVRAALAGVEAVCAGRPDAGPASAGSRRERFGWLTAPRSTILQTSPAHTSLTDDPAAELTRLMSTQVRI